MSAREVTTRSQSAVTPMFLLFLLFLGLKLTGYIDWSWWYVTMPLWAPGAFVLAILAVMAVIAGVVTLWPERRRG